MSYQMKTIGERTLDPAARPGVRHLRQRTEDDVPVALDIASSRPVHPPHVAGHPGLVHAMLGPYQLKLKLSQDDHRPDLLLFDSTVQHQDTTPALDCIFALRVTLASDAGRIVYSLVSLADESSGYHHADAIQLAASGSYRLTASVCDPNGAGGTISLSWVAPHSMALGYISVGSSDIQTPI